MADDFNSGTIQDEGRTKTRFPRKGLPITFQDGTAGNGRIAEGQEVYLSANNTVKTRTLGSQYPIGTITVAKNLRLPTQTTCTVATFFDRDLYVTSAAALTVGTFVVPTGTQDADGGPLYAAAASGDWVCAVVIAGGAAGSEVRLGILNQPFIKA
jgi:hypothetical protein